MKSGVLIEKILDATEKLCVIILVLFLWLFAIGFVLFGINEKIKIMRHIESTLQCSCVRWFRYQYPQYTLFAIPNGGNRNAITGAIMKKEGVLAGVADLFLMLPNHEFHGLFIEMKTDKGKQSDSQKMFQFQAEAFGYGYAVCHNFEEFQETILNYIHNEMPDSQV